MQKFLAAFFVIAGFSVPLTYGVAQAAPANKTKTVKKPVKKTVKKTPVSENSQKETEVVNVAGLTGSSLAISLPFTKSPTIRVTSICNGATRCTVCFVPQPRPVPTVTKTGRPDWYGSISRQRACCWISKREANWPTNAATRNKEKRWQQQNRTNLLFYKRFLSQYE